MLAVLLVTATMLAYTAAIPPGVRAEHTEGFGPIDHFTVEFSESFTTATAGVPIDVTVTAYDHDDVVITDYSGATMTGTLGSSTTGCSGPCDPDYGGTLTFTNGVATTQVTAYLAETGVHVTVTDEATSVVSSSATFDVVAGDIATLDVDPDTATIAAGETQAYTATGADAYGNDLGDVTTGTAFDLDGDACSGASCGSTVAETYTVTGTNGSASDSVNLTVEPGPLASIELSPPTSTLSADDVPETYSAEGFDEHGNSRGDVTDDTTFGIDGGGSCLANACGSTTVGEYTVTGDAGGSITDTSTLTVIPGELDRFEIETDLTGDAVAGTAFGVTVTAYDAHDNVKTDYASGTLTSTLANSPNGTAPTVPASLSWSNGVGTASVTPTKAEPTADQTVTVTDGTVSQTSNQFAVLPGPLASFTIASISTPQTAGTGFTVTATAYDAYGNVKTNYAGGASLTSTLASSPNGTAPTVPASLTWGAGTGIGSTTVTPVNAALTATQTVTLTDGTVSATSNTFAVHPAPVDTLHFSTSAVFYDPSFAGQPLDTKVGAPIYSVCTPPAASATNPCGLAPATSTGVRVLALDQFGNRVLDGTSVTLGTSPASTGLGTATTVNGVADFLNQPVISSLGNFRLKAASNTKTTVSDQRRIVDELVACTGQTCVNNVGNGSANLQRLYGRVRTDGTFFQAGTTNVLLTTQFLPGSATTGQCQGNQTIGQSTDLRVQGLGVGATAPSTQMVLILPRETMMALGVTSRGTGNFDVCLGVITVDGSTPAPWKAKDPTSKKLAFRASVARQDEGQTRYWGVPAECGSTVVTKGVVEGLSPTDPCIGLRSKLASEIKAYLQMTDEEFAALGVRDADLVMVIEKRAPWDGKGAIY